MRLKKVDPAKNPESLLFRAFNFITQWDYTQAAIYLRRYVALPDLSDYQRSTGEANLVAALNYLRSPDARDVLEGLLARVRKTSYRRLLGYLLLRKGELEVGARQWPAAFSALTEALKISEEDSMDHFLVRKWSTIVSLYSDPARHSLTLYELIGLHAQAKVRREWETVRSMDFHRSVATKDETLARLVYFGTPHSTFRERLADSFPHLSTETEYVWSHGNPTQIVSLDEGLSGPSLQREQLGHRLITALSQDFYRPVKMAEIFSSLYPEEQFNVETSPVRIRKAVERARAGLKASKLGCHIRLIRGMYSLDLPASLGIRIRLDRKRGAETDRLAPLFASRPLLSLREIQTGLNLSPSRAARRVRKWCREGKLETAGGGRGARYRLNTK